MYTAGMLGGWGGGHVSVSCLGHITWTHLLEEALGLCSPKHRLVGEELFCRIYRQRGIVKSCNNTQRLKFTTCANNLSEILVLRHSTVCEILTIEPGAECEFCGERRADGRPLTGLEPFPPWNFAEETNLKKLVQNDKNRNMLE